METKIKDENKIFDFICFYPPKYYEREESDFIFEEHEKINVCKILTDIVKETSFAYMNKHTGLFTFLNNDESKLYKNILEDYCPYLRMHIEGIEPLLLRICVVYSVMLLLKNYIVNNLLFIIYIK